MTMTNGGYITEALITAGVERVYGIVGDSLNGFTDALRASKEIRWVHTRHEEAAAFAAGAEAAVTGKLAVCAGSCGPGNLHLINGLFDCQQSRVPVLAIAAHIPSTEIGIEYFQATHPESLFKECSHYVELVSSAAQLPRILARAMRVAIARRGVAVVVIPGDVALEDAVSNPPSWIAPNEAIHLPASDDIQQLADILDGGQRITMLCGAGCAGAHEEVLQLAERLQAPIVHTLRGKEHIEYGNDFDVGMTGLVGLSSGYAAMEACDTLLLLGADFPYRQFYPTNARIVQVDLRPEALGNRCHIEFGVVGEVRGTLQALLPLVKPRTGASEHLERARAHYAATRKALDGLATFNPSTKIIHPQYVTSVVSELADEDAVFTCDVGTPILWTARYLKVNGKRRIIGSFNHGSMANAMLHAIGAQAAFPKRQVISMSGDGGFTMMMGDFITLVQEKLPVKVIVLNNGTLGFVELEMKANGFLDTGCNLQNPNFAAMANAMGVKGIRVEDPSELRKALLDAFSHDGPALVDVVSAGSELAMPPRVQAKDAVHFGLFMLKAVLDGRGAELLDLAKVNLVR